ncbi:MAG: hypothetical protein A2Y63_00580 [Candidatus Riflebacteria bacterium RBG_13_59_9]|nr:MAG: hypothetical protein A2Y63_00580 [Candidatus Riflebacteria bacterium RBG_13_59_9]
MRWGTIPTTGKAVFVLLLLALVSTVVPAQPQKAPAQYKRSGSFFGGRELPGCALTGLRFGKHPDFLRIVLDLSIAQDDKLIGAPRHPPYRVEYRQFPYRLCVSFEGVKYNEDAQVETKDAVPLSIVTKANNDIQLIEMFLQGPALFKVIEVDDPAKLAIDVKYLPGEPIPTIYAIQLQDVKDVQAAFALLAAGDFPENFEPNVIVVGNAVFVEDTYLTLEEASVIVARLEKAGYSAMITERKGDELPRH